MTPRRQALTKAESTGPGRAPLPIVPAAAKWLDVTTYGMPSRSTGPADHQLRSPSISGRIVPRLRNRPGVVSRQQRDNRSESPSMGPSECPKAPSRRPRDTNAQAAPSQGILKRRTPHDSKGPDGTRSELNAVALTCKPAQSDYARGTGTNLRTRMKRLASETAQARRNVRLRATKVLGMRGLRKSLRGRSSDGLPVSGV